MTAEEELLQLRHEKSLLQEQLAQRDELIAQMQQQLTQRDDLIAQMQQQLAMLSEQVQTLQAQLQKDSHNSHLPPSSDRFVRQPKSLRKSSGKQAGGQTGHQGTTLSLTDTPDEVIVHAVEVCAQCQHDLRAIASQALERRQVIDVPPKRVVVSEHQAERKCCPVCQHVTEAPFPHEVKAPVQYGAGVGAIAVYLVQAQLLPYERACEVLHEVLGASLTGGTLKTLVDRCAEHLAPVEQLIKEHVQQVAVLHQDETGLYVEGKRSWLHVSATEHLTHYAVHPKRGKDALEAIGILPGFTGVSVHDGWRAYQSYPCRHALCNVHHLRELTFLSEVLQQAWAGEMITLLLDIKHAVQQARSQGHTHLHPLEVHDWKARYVALLVEGYQANPLPTEPPPKRKGRRKQSPARNLLDRLSTKQEAVLAFLEDFAVPFDNSLAERDIRMVKVQQKVSGCFRSLGGSQAFCRIRGYVSTLRKQGLSVLNALEAAMLGHPVLPSF
jgi:transposase